MSPSGGYIYGQNKEKSVVHRLNALQMVVTSLLYAHEETFQ